MLITRKMTDPDTLLPPDRSGTRLHVALDVRTMDNSGIGTYIESLLQGFAIEELPVDWTFVGPICEVPDSLSIRDWIEFDAPLYSRREFNQYPRLDHVDVFHYPLYNLPRTQAPATVVTVHDLFHLVYGSFPKRIYQRFFLSRLRFSSAYIAAISEKTMEDLQIASNIPAERLVYIPQGPGRALPVSGPSESPKACTLYNGKKIEAPWLLAVGINKDHKNFEFMISAISHWLLKRPDAPPLIWIGSDKETLAERTLKIPAHARTRIHLEPYRAEADIETLYAGAMGLIFPSLDEGFGFPPLEAMNRNVPVLCSERRPMTDILGDAPLYFDPLSSSSLCRQIEELLDNPEARAHLKSKGRRQVEKYNWGQTARQTFRLYLHAAEEALEKTT